MLPLPCEGDDLVSVLVSCFERCWSSILSGWIGLLSPPAPRALPSSWLSDMDDELSDDVEEDEDEVEQREEGGCL